MLKTINEKCKTKACKDLEGDQDRNAAFLITGCIFVIAGVLFFFSFNSY